MVVRASSLASVGQFIGMRTQEISGTISEFIRTNPIITGAAFGGSVLGGLGLVQLVRRVRRRTTKPRKRRKTTRKRKARPGVRRVRSRKRKIIRGRGLGTHEIRHSGKSTKGKFKLVSFRDKRTGKMVRFKAHIKPTKRRRRR